MSKKKLAVQLLMYVSGLFIIAFGIAIAINSDLGISPVSSLPFVVSLISGIGVGTCVTAFFLICILIQIILLGKEFKWINLSQIIFSFIFGYFVDFAIFVMGDLRIPTYAGQLVMLFISIILISFGLTLYLDAKLISLPPEGLVSAIAQKTQSGMFHRAKIATDTVIVLLAIALSLIFLGGVYGVREGTVITAVLAGKLMPYCKRVISLVAKRL